MARLQQAFLERVENFCDRCLDAAEAARKSRCPRPIYEQLIASCTSVGANAYEAAQAMSRKDFAKSLQIGVKEASETVFWLRLVGRRGWVAPTRLDSLLLEADELQRILGAIITKTRTPKSTPAS